MLSQGVLQKQHPAELRNFSLLAFASPEEGMATHPSILAQKIPWTEEPGGLQSMASQRVGHTAGFLDAQAKPRLWGQTITRTSPSLKKPHSLPHAKVSVQKSR